MVGRSVSAARFIGIRARLTAPTRINGLSRRNPSGIGRPGLRGATVRARRRGRAKGVELVCEPTRVRTAGARRRPIRLGAAIMTLAGSQHNKRSTPPSGRRS